jgi:hypothetical protein
MIPLHGFLREVVLVDEVVDGAFVPTCGCAFGAKKGTGGEASCFRQQPEAVLLR